MTANCKHEHIEVIEINEEHSEVWFCCGDCRILFEPIPIEEAIKQGMIKRKK